jgi:hypothetical protein
MLTPQAPSAFHRRRDVRLQSTSFARYRCETTSASLPPPAPMGYLFLVQTKMKVAVYVCIGLSVLVCVCWPIAVFLSIFAFDAPSRGAADMPGRYIGVMVFLGISLGTRRRLDPFRCAEEQGRVEAVAYVCASASSVSSPRDFLCSNECDLEVKDEGQLFFRTQNETLSHRRDVRLQSRSFALRNQSLRRNPNSNRLC